ncbi:3-dehydroquinate synthase [Pseudothermotoga thermarum]|uniref:Multifunctional fusion protein n=1 Tax=Pseudothermotoga thermarum DSM 5069 TaxID=688269 RepID=F7YWY9_9THEM|nr:3-dehydroquinate synthase [Pseudothermotoga thermarum]AEH50581.1 3-dehydroquinate synthase [Pseudothermotoga thermarum DSM 5069]
MKKSVVLCGLSGSGKTTVGKILAEKLGWFFIDTDQLVEDTTSMDIPKIFQIYGEEGFRQFEKQMVEKVCKLQNVVISIGAGAVTKNENVDLLKKNCVVVFLNAPIDILVARLENDSSRPLLNSANTSEKRNKLEVLQKQREPIYRQIADITVDASLQPEKIAREIARKLESYGLEERNLDIEGEIITVKTQTTSYNVRIGYNITKDSVIDFLKKRMPSKVAVVTNPLLNQIIAKKMVEELNKEGIESYVILIEDSEERKSPETLFKIIDEFAKFGLDRESFVVAVGGGVIGDVTGFAAAIYMRGIKWIYVPTTMLAQVDSSIGGKVAVNYGEKKNFLGSFHQPSFVVTDTKFLEILPNEIFTEGLAEVVKSAVIDGKKFFNYLAQNVSKILERDPKVVFDVVSFCVKLKGKIVEQDEKDLGLRMVLNLGHTFGHAIEACLNYQISHAKAVSVGLVLETMLSHLMGYADLSTKDRIENVLNSLGLPTSPRQIELSSVRDLLKYMKFDKKAARGKLRFTIPFKIGDVRVIECDPSEVKNLIEQMEGVLS